MSQNKAKNKGFHLGVSLSEKERVGLYASIFPSAYWRQERIYAAIPYATFPMKDLIKFSNDIKSKKMPPKKGA